MAVFLFLLAVLGTVVVGDLVLENTAVGEVTVFNQAVTGHSEGILLAMAAALGFVVAMLLAASVASTAARRTRRGRLRSGTPGRHGQAPEPDHGSLLDELFGHQQPVGGTAAPPGPTDRRRRH
jgi:hypothetical protein